MATTPQTLPLLHRLLGVALIMIAAVVLIFRYLGIGPMLPPDRLTLVIAYTLSGFGVVLAAVALFVFKPHVPARAPAQSVEQYWSTPAVGAKVLLVWILLEGAGTLAATGYLVTGNPVSAIVTGLAIVAFWLCGPNVFAKA